MLFRDGELNPQTLTDPSLRAVFERLGQFTTPPIQASDLVTAIHECGSKESVSSLPTRRTRFRREDFSPAAQAVLDEFSRMMERGRLPPPLSLALFLKCAVRHASHEKPGGIPPTPQQTGPVTGEHDSAQAAPEQRDQPFTLPAQLAASEDLTHRVRTAIADGPYPFDGEPVYEGVFEALGRALHRRQPRHVLLTGERGVGKTTVLVELARRAANGQFHHLRDKRFVLVDARYTPPDEARPRLEAILNCVAGRSELVVCLDGLATLLRGERGSSNLLPLFGRLVNARCQLIALLTPTEYEEVAAEDVGIGEFFSRVEVPEPDPALALRLLAHFASGLATRYELTIDNEAVREAVALTAGYVLNDQLPAKAIKVLTRACEDVDYDRRHAAAARDHIGPADVIRVVAELSGVPEATLCGVADRTDYDAALGGVVFGQAHAVREVATELGLIKAGMTDPTKPASVMLFLGQTGTGKTEMAKALARFYSGSKRLRTYTLGNCVEPHSVATVIGVPPGYVGSDRGGRIVNELNADPYGVFLLDEADKAHPDVLQPFLNLFDEGWVTDQRGAKGYAGKSIFVLTTNVGQRMIADMHREGKTIEEITVRMKEALGQIRHGKSDRPVFAPEFLARIKRVVVFRPLDRAAMDGIAGKLLAELSSGWVNRRGKELVFPAGLAEYVGAAAYQVDEKSGGKEGGRVVRKLIADWVEAPLQQEIARHPDAYRRAARVTTQFTAPANPGADPLPVPTITIEFG